MADNNTLKHVFTSGKADDADTSLVRPSNWNKEHIFSGGSNGQYLIYDGTKSDHVTWDTIWLRFNIVDITKPPYNAAGDGVTSDVSVINTAVNDLHALGGGVIYFPSKTFAIGTGGMSFTSKNNIFLMGSPGTKLLTTGTPSGSGQDVAGACWKFTTCTGWRIEGIQFDFVGATYDRAGFGLVTCSKFIIMKNSFVNPGGLGAIRSNGGSFNQYLENYVADGNATARGFWLGNTTTPEKYALVQGNRMENLLTTSIGGGLQYSNIIGNIIKGNSTAGIINCASSGVDPQYWARGNNFVGNYIEKGGIQLDCIAPAEALDITIASNTLIGPAPAGYGIGIYNGRRVSCVGNVVTDMGLSAGTHVGIDIYKGYQIIVKGNVIDDTRATKYMNHGIRCIANGTSSSTGVAADGNSADISVEGNIVRGALSNGINFATVGGASDQIDGVQIIGNLVRSTGTLGITCFSSAAPPQILNTVVANNVSLGHASYDIRLWTINENNMPSPLICRGNIYVNGLAAQDTVPSVTGVSSRGVITGTVSIADTAVSAAVAFGTGRAEADANYHVLCTAESITAGGAVGNIYITSKATTGFTVNVDTAPGAGKTIVIAYTLVR